MIKISTLLFVGVLMSSHTDPQAPLGWSWFRASSIIDDWWITKGRADVTISQGSFKATLWDGNAQNFARLDLSGSINRNTVRVKVTVNNSDVEPFYTSGKLTRSCWKEGGREAIVLTSGLGVIGLVRELPAGRCIPTP
jgi:hypothetical protein